MYTELMTKEPANSPLMGLFSIDQIAFIVRDDAEEQKVKELLRLHEANWVEDEVVAEGYVRGYAGSGKARNVAKLLFNYDLGIEVEILRYTDGINYADVNNVESCQLAHIGFHLHKGAEMPASLRDWVFEAPIIQKVETVSHTNPFLKETGRKYRYTIYDTKATIGTHLKVIERIEEGNSDA